VNARATPGDSGRVARAPRRAVQQSIPVWPGVCTAALVGAVYLTIASGGTFRFEPSSFPHHVLIADAWLHGQLNVREAVLQQRSELYYQRFRAGLEARYRMQGRRLTEEEWQRIRPTLKTPLMHDWTYVNGKYYGYWGPMPAVLMLPYVAVAGVNASDRLVSGLLGAGTVLLIFLMLREVARLGCVPLSAAACVALAVLFGLGTVHFYLAVMGQVWFLSQVTAAFFLTLSIWALLRSDRAWGWAALAGAAFGAALLARNSVVMTGPFVPFALFGLWRRTADAGWAWLLRRVLGFGVPLALAGVVMLAYNQARFGSPFEDGVRAMLKAGAPQFRQDYEAHGVFNLYYVPRNAYYYFLNPLLHRQPPTQAITFDGNGNSMFLVTPALLYVFGAFRRRNWLVTSAALGAGSSLAMLLCFFGTGWFNFGNRYLLDLMPLAILLIAAGMQGRLTRVSTALITLSVLINSWGTYRFMQEQF